MSIRKILTVSFILISFIASFSNDAQALTTHDNDNHDSKAAQEEAKALAKEGWKPMPGTKSIAAQLDDAYMMTLDQYILGSAKSSGRNLEMTKKQALTLAKQDLASNIEIDIQSTIDQYLENEIISAEEANSMSELIIKGKSQILQHINSPTTVVCIYRALSPNIYEVMIRLAYPSQSSIDILTDLPQDIQPSFTD